MSIKQKMINKLADVLTRGRKIQIRQGEAIDFKPSTLDVGEFGLITDENKVMIGTIGGTPIQVNGGSRSYNATISTTWAGTTAPYTQEIAVTGILATDNPFITPIYDDDNTIAIAESKTWNEISKIITDTNKIIVTCFEDKPTTAINILIKVVD